MSEVLYRMRYWQAFYLRHHTVSARELNVILHLRDVSPKPTLNVIDTCLWQQFPANHEWVADIERRLVRGFDQVNTQAFNNMQLKAALACLNVRK